MLRSKATAALMKLKEIDRKYKIKSSDDVKPKSNLSDISGIDSGDEISKHSAGSGDKSDLIIHNARPKLDIRMPEAHMERTVAQGTESELVMIFDKSRKHSPKPDAYISPRIVDPEAATEKPDLDDAVEKEDVSEALGITSSKNPSPAISEERDTASTETSISEDVPEVISSSHPVSNHFEADVSREMTLKSVESTIDADERVQSDLDEDPSTLLASRTYSDDFVKTLPSESAKESNASPEKRIETEALELEETSLQMKDANGTSPSYRQSSQSLRLDEDTEPETNDIEELVSAELPRTRLRDQVKKIDADMSEEAKNLGYQKSSQSSSARTIKDRQRSRRPHTSMSSRDSKSQEFSSSFRHKDSKIPNTSEDSNPSFNSPKTNRSGNERDLKKLQTNVLPETREDQRDAVAYGDSWSSKDEATPVIRNEKAFSKTKNLKHTRVKDSSPKEPPRIYSKGSKINASVIEPVPLTMVRPVSKYPQFLKDDDVAFRPAQRAFKYRSDSRRQNKRRSRKPKTEDSRESRHRTKGGSLRQGKKQTSEEPGLGHEARNVDRLEQQMKEFCLQQERDQLRTLVRRYVQQMMIEQRRLSVLDDGFQGPIDQFDHGTTGLGQTKSLQSFFKPLDLPNVAAFKRPDFEDYQAADLDNKRHLHLRMIRERVLGIRHWLKQQFVLYRDYSRLVSAINSKYIPVTLKETKKMIHDMQHDRERRHCVR